MIIIDTNIAIGFRDGDLNIIEALAMFGEQPKLSFVTRIELESGANRDAGLGAMRRALLDSMLKKFEVLTLGEADVLAYGRIVAARGFDRRRILDRLIAAQCLTRRAALVTANAADFADIADLTLHRW